MDHGRFRERPSRSVRKNTNGFWIRFFLPVSLLLLLIERSCRRYYQVLYCIRSMYCSSNTTTSTKLLNPFHFNSQKPSVKINQQFLCWTDLARCPSKTTSHQMKRKCVLLYILHLYLGDDRTTCGAMEVGITCSRGQGIPRMCGASGFNMQTHPTVWIQR